MYLGERDIGRLWRCSQNFSNQPPLFILRSYCYLFVIFVDSSYPEEHNFSVCKGGLIQSLGSTTHPVVKSVLVSKKEIEFLGFDLNYVEMEIKLSDCKPSKIISKTENLVYWKKTVWQGWSATDVNTPIGCKWSSFKRNHINHLELKTSYWL